VALALSAELLLAAGRRDEARTRAQQALTAASGPIPGVDLRERARHERGLADIRAQMDRLIRGMGDG
jgi:hypothetical protein